MTKENIRVPARAVFTSPQMLLAFGFGSGLSPVVPGTMGTLAAVPFYFLIQPLVWWAYLLVLIIGTLLGNYLCEFASKKLNVHDHGGIVWDEFIGFWLTMFLVPFSVVNLLLGFVLFRVFDMAKPWPISWLDKHVSGGVGIMLDDLAAGLAACASLHAILWFWG